MAAAASGITPTPVADLIRVALSPTQPAHPGDGDLTRFHDALTRLYELDDHYGGGGVYTLAVQAVHRIRHLVNRTILRSDTERALLTLAGHAAEHAGWLAYDAGLPGQARYWWFEALHTARHLDSDTLTTSVIASMSLQAAATGQPSDALDLAHCAARAARTRTTPRLASLLSARLAVGHAKTGDRRAAQRALSHAHDCVDQPRHDDDPPLTTLRRDHDGTAVRRLCDWASTMLPESVPAWT